MLLPLLFTLLSQYHFDFSRIFASPEAEKADRAVLERDLTSLQSLRGKVADHLLRALELNDSIRARQARHDAYLYLRQAVDTRDEKAAEDEQAIDTEVAQKTAFLRDEILKIDDDRLRGMQLGPYRFAIEKIRRWAPHTLSESEEKVLSATEPMSIGWQSDLYDKLMASMPPSRPKTAEEFQKRWSALAAKRDEIAFALVRLASSNTAIAKLRHFDDAPSMSYFARDLTRPKVKSLLDRVAANAGIYKRYQRLRADHIKANANLWDVYAADSQSPKFTIDEARSTILAATAPLGSDYARELSALLDPANGRMDIEPGPNRLSGGFSEGAPGMASVFFSRGFAGSYDDMRVLAHESTHAVQRQLMNIAPMPFDYRRGANYLAESLAIFNELALADFMAAHAKTPDEKRFYLEQFLDGKGMAAFAIAPEAELEEAVYDGVAAGTIRNADDLDAVTRRVYDRYSIWPSKHDELKEQWMAVRLMYDDPFYDLNYVYGAIIGLRMFAMYQRDPSAFAAHYVALMRNGYTAPAPALLNQFFGIDLDDPALLDDVVNLLRERVDQLQAEYAR